MLSLSDSLSQMPVCKLLADYITAAASGSRPSLLYLVVAIFTSARSTVSCLTTHFQSMPRFLAEKNMARLGRCARRLEAIFYTLRHAPGRFLYPSQLRALLRARAVLAHIWNQPVDFSPIVPLLVPKSSSCKLQSSICNLQSSPATPSSNLSLNESRQGRKNLAQHVSAGKLAGNNAEVPSGTTEISPAHPAPSPLLLRTPGRALATVLLQLGRIYGIAPSPILFTSPSNSQPAIPNSQSSASDSSQISNFKSQIDGNDSSFITHHSSFPPSSLPPLPPNPG